MNMKKCTYILLILIFSLALSSCKEAADGADQIADEVTGKSQIEKKIKMEKQIEDMTKKKNKDLQDALDKVNN